MKIVVFLQGKVSLKNKPTTTTNNLYWLYHKIFNILKFGFIDVEITGFDVLASKMDKKGKLKNYL